MPPSEGTNLIMDQTKVDEMPSNPAIGRAIESSRVAIFLSSGAIWRIFSFKTNSTKEIYVCTYSARVYVVRAVKNVARRASGMRRLFCTPSGAKTIE